MRTRSKVLLSVSVSLFFLFLSLYVVLSAMISKSYMGFEREILSGDVARVGDALDSRRDDLYTKLGDWAQWDDTYDFIEDGNQDYVTSNLQNEAFGLLNINLIAVSDDTGNLLFARRVDSGESKDFPDSLRTLLQTHPYFTTSEKDMVHRGVLMLPEGPVMFASRPVTSSDGLADPRGHLFFGYFLDAEDTLALSALTHLKVDMWRYDDISRNPQFQVILDGLNKSPVFIPTVGKSASTIFGFITVPDALTGEPALVLAVEKSRDIYLQGQEGVRLFLWTMVGAGFLITLVVLGLFEFIVLRKLSRLDHGVTVVSQSGDLKARVPVEGTDELAQLGQEINRMLSALEDLAERQAETDSQLRLIADITSIMIWMSDQNGKATYFNKGWTDFTGGTLEDSLGDGWVKYLHPDDLEGVKKMTGLATEAREPFQVEYRLRRHDGEYRWILANGKAYFREQEFQGYIRSGIDITERKLNEDHDRQTREETEKMNQLMVARELRMAELKEELKKLRSEQSEKSLDAENHQVVS